MGGGAEEVLSAARLPVVSQSVLNAQLLQRVTELENRLSGADGPIFHYHYQKEEGEREEGGGGSSTSSSSSFPSCLW